MIRDNEFRGDPTFAYQRRIFETCKIRWHFEKLKPIQQKWKQVFYADIDTPR